MLVVDRSGTDREEGIGDRCTPGVVARPGGTGLLEEIGLCLLSIVRFGVGTASLPRPETTVWPAGFEPVLDCTTDELADGAGTGRSVVRRVEVTDRLLTLVPAGAGAVDGRVAEEERDAAVLDEAREGTVARLEAIVWARWTDSDWAKFEAFFRTSCCWRSTAADGAAACFGTVGR